MKKILIIIAGTLYLISCDKSQLPELASGVVLDEMFLSAAPGKVSVSVETAGDWVVNLPEEAGWISLDVKGGSGNGAFTLSYQSNMSDASVLTSSRKAEVVISTKDNLRSDTLNVIQYGLKNTHEPCLCTGADHLQLEFEKREQKEVTVVYCSSEGLNDTSDLKSWANKFDIVAAGDRFLVPDVGSNVYHGPDGISFVTADMSYLMKDNDETAFASDSTIYMAFKELIDTTYNALNSDPEWIIGGQLYHYSMMQAGYQSSPQWYPVDPMLPVFDTDRYAWANKLYDIVWLSSRDYIDTWTDPDTDRSYMADYVYVSRDVLARVYSVEVLDIPVAGMTHKPVKLTLKY